jgi:3-oxoacyl-[acyl-carrier-protein] synthase-3
MLNASVISGVGMSLPEVRFSNERLAMEGIATGGSDEWILQRTGIAERRWAEPGTTTADLAVAAGGAALSAAHAEGADLVLVATSTPDRPCPAIAPEVAWRLGLTSVPACDVDAVCSGFVYALALADALIRSGAHERILVVGADRYSQILDPADHTTAIIFGDGAGAVFMRRGSYSEPGAIRAVHLGSDGSGADLICVPSGPERHPWLPTPPPSHAWFSMQGRAVYARSVRQTSEAARKVLATVGWSAGQVEAFIGHQANQRILDAVAERLGIAPTRMFGNIREIGNTAAASIPIVLAETLLHDKVRAGAPALFTAFGGGLTWGAAALTWPAATAVKRPPSAASTPSAR